MKHFWQLDCMKGAVKNKVELSWLELGWVGDLRFDRTDLLLIMCFFFPLSVLDKKERFTQKCKIQLLSTHRHADGKAGEGCQSSKHFWSFTTEQCWKTDNWSRQNEKITNIFEKNVFTPLMGGQSCARTWNRVRANAFSLAATVKISV